MVYSFWSCAFLFYVFSGLRDVVKHSQENEPLMKGTVIAQKLLLRGKTKEVLSHAHVRSLEQRARNVHDQSEQTPIHIMHIISNQI